MTRYKVFFGSVLCGALMPTAGCSKTDNSKANFRTAINSYYQAHPACLWSEAKKFPIQAAIASLRASTFTHTVRKAF